MVAAFKAKIATMAVGQSLFGGSPWTTWFVSEKMANSTAVPRFGATSVYKLVRHGLGIA